MGNFDSVDPEWSHSDQNSAGRSESDNDSAHNEHYVNVGKSKLNKNLDLLMDPKYSSKVVERKNLNDFESSSGDSDLSSASELESVGSSIDEFAQDSNQEELESNNGSIDSDTKINELDEWSGLESADDISNENYQSDDYSHSGVSDNSNNDKDAQSEDYSHSDVSGNNLETENPIITKATDLDKGQHVRNQLATWERLLDFRIRVQKLVDTCNVIPSRAEYKVNLDTKSDEERKEIENLSVQLCSLFDQLVQIRLVLFFN